MTIVRDIEYKKQLMSILRYIANDKVSAAIKFEKNSFPIFLVGRLFRDPLSRSFCPNFHFIPHHIGGEVISIKKLEF